MKVLIRAVAVCTLVLLAGCGGIKEWAHETFDQGKEHAQQRKIINQYLRSLSIYDQFSTVALFDALWLSDEIRTLYAQNYAAMHGRSEEVEKTFLRRQLKANTQHISFYVLSTHEIPLNLKPSEWVMHLVIADKKYAPTEVKAVELAPEYESFFGKTLSNHKRPYEVRFERKDTDGKDILYNAESMKLVFSGPVHYSSVSWDISKNSQSMEHEHESDSNRG